MFGKATPLPKVTQTVSSSGWKFHSSRSKAYFCCERKGICKLMKTAEPRFKIPSRTYFSNNVIPAQYYELRRVVESFLSNVQFCSITSDLWTSKYQTRGYMGLTCHTIDGDWNLKSFTLNTVQLTEKHTAQNISDALSEVMDDWGIQSKSVGSTTDNGTNITNAMKILDLFNMSCVGHTLQLGITKSLSYVQ